MLPFSWGRWLRSLFQRRNKPVRNQKAARRALLVEHLETRLAPATYTWVGGGPDNNWSDGANWKGGVAPTGSAITLDDLVFGSGAATLSTNNNLVGGTFNSITFAGSGYTLAGNSLTLGSPTSASGSGYLIANAGAANDNIALNISLGGTLANQQFFTVNFGATLTISGQITSVSSSQLTKEGTGTLTVNGSNGNFTGPFTIDPNSGIVIITNSNALGSSSTPITVGTNSTLELKNVANPILEGLKLNGPGISNNGALLNLSGNNTWAGNIEMDSNCTFGATAGELTVTGTINDLGAGYNLTKEGPGELYLDPLNNLAGNGYRGNTIINGGILAIGHPFALGAGGATTIVNSTIVESGTLALQYTANSELDIPAQYLNVDQNGNVIGFQVPNEFLTINGPGVEGILVAPRDPVVLPADVAPTSPVVTTTGAITSLIGYNSWEQTVNFWTSNSSVRTSGDYYEPAVTAGAAANATLVFDGVLQDPGITTRYSFSKVGAGRVVLTNTNTFTADVDVLNGELNIRDSNALGSVSTNKTVWWGGSLELQSDDIPDSATSTRNSGGTIIVPDYNLELPAADTFVINGPGYDDPVLGPLGALHNISGTNKIEGTVFLESASSIDVEPDPDPTNANSDPWNDFSQLTIDGVIQGGFADDLAQAALTKIGLGELVLTAANTYEAETFIDQGWITIRNDTALGPHITSLGDTAQPETTVESGAALVLKTDLSGNSLTVENDLTLSGTGITNRYAWLNQDGALLNLGGNNTLTGNIVLNGGAVGIGVEIDGGLQSPPPSYLVLMGSMSETNGPSGITKLGSQRLTIQGDGTYTGPVDIHDGVLRIQNDTALGAGVSSTTVETGTALELMSTVPALNGGVTRGLQVWNEQLILNGSGNAAFGDQPLAVDPSDDQMWRGPVVLANSITLTIPASSRLTLYGAISDSGNPSALGSSITVTGGGELSLYGASSYRGNTYLDQGVLTVGNNQALGAGGVSQVETLTLTGATAVSTQFTLTFNGGTATAPITYTGTAADAGTIQNALQQLATVGGVGGQATVTQSGSVFTITFGGGLEGFSQSPGLGAAISAGPGSVAVKTVTVGTGGVQVASGASLQLQGNITVSDKPLIVQGQGDSSSVSAPLQWFNVGPAPIDNGQTAGNGNVTGRVTGVAVDPTDSNVIYIATAGGGAWKTINGGQTWLPLFDLQSSTLFGGAIAIDPADPEIIYFGTGEADDSFDSYAGTGLYKSLNSGKTWTLMTDSVNGANPFLGMGITAIAVDPNDPHALPTDPFLYVSDGDQSQDAFSGTQTPGVWSYNPTPSTGFDQWLNLTAVVSTGRALNNGQLSAPPGTPGPDDDFRVSFPQGDATWQSVAVTEGSWVFNDVAGFGPIVYAALGTPQGDLANGVYWSINADSENPTWYLGTPATQQDEIQQITVDGTSGVYELFFKGWGTGPAPSPGAGEAYLPYNASAAQIQKELDFLPSIGGVNGKVVVTQVSQILGQAVYDVEFEGALGDAAQPLLTATTGGTGDTVTISEIQQGGGYDDRSAAEFPVGDFATGIPLYGNIKISIFSGGSQGTTSVYASAAEPDPPVGDGELESVFVSQTGGLTWAATSSQPPNYMRQQGGYDNAIYAASATTVYVGGATVDAGSTAQQAFVSTDGGASWQDISVDTTGNGPHSDIHGITGGPDGEVIFVTDGGVWRLNPTDNTWVDINGNLAITQLNSVSLNPTTPNIAVGGSQNNGGEAYDGVLNWTLVNTGDGGETAIDPKDPSIVYQVQDGSLLKSTSSGVLGSFSTILVVGGEYFPFALDQINDSRLVVGGATLEESTNAGATWTDLDSPIGISSLALATYQGPFVADPAFPAVTDEGANTYDPDTIYVTNGSQVDVTKDHGDNWVDRSPGITDIQDIEVNAANQDNVFVVAPGTVLESTNAGRSWANITSNLPAHMAIWSLVIDPRNGNLYVGTDEGVWYSTNNGTSWLQFAGMPEVQVKDVELDQGQDILYAGTYGRSMYELFLSDVPANSGAFRAISGSSVWTGPVELAGNTSIGASGQQTLLNGISVASLNIVGSIGDLAGGSKLTKIDSGDVILSGANTYSGPTEVVEGNLVVHNPLALGGSSAGTTVDAGAALELESNLSGTPITLNGDGILFNGHYQGALHNVSNSNTYTGVITLNTNSTIGVDSGSTLTILSPGGITDDSNSYTLTKELTGTLVLASADSYHGNTYVNQGALDVANNNALGAGGATTEVLDGAQLQMSGNTTVSNETLSLSGTGIFGTGAIENIGGVNHWAGSVLLARNAGFAPPTTPPSYVGFGALATGGSDALFIDGVVGPNVTSLGFIKVGPGVVVLTNANVYAGETTVAAGYLRLRNNLALGYYGTVLVDSGAELDLDGDPTNVGASLTVTGTDILLNGNGVSPGNAGGFRNLTGNNTWTGGVTLQSNSSIGADPGTQLTLNGHIVDPSPVPASPASLTKVGQGTVILPVANSYDGTTYVNAGDLNIQNSGALGTLSSEVQEITTANNGTAGTFTLTFNGVNTVALANGVAGSGGSGAAASVQNALNALSTIGGVGGSVTVTRTNNAANNYMYTVTFGGTLAGLSLPLMLTASTGGETVGNTRLTAGSLTAETQTVTLGGATAGSTKFTLSFGGSTTAALTYTGTSADAGTVQTALNALASIHGVGGVVAVTQVGAVFTVQFSGSLAGASLPLLGAAVTAGSGSASVNRVTAGAGGTVVASGGTLQVQGGITLSSESLTLNGTGFNNAGALENVSGNNIWADAILLGSNSQIGVDNAANTLAITQPITDVGAGLGVTEVGAGTLDYQAANLYTGLTQVAQGTLLLDKNGGNAIAGNLTVGGTLAGTPTAIWNYSNEMQSTATATVLADGTLNLNGMTQTLGKLAITDGQATTGATGSGQLTVGNLTMTGGTLTLATAGSDLILAGGVTATSDGPATITGPGTVSLNGSTRTFTVNAGAQTVDLVINSVIAGTGSEGLIKTGTGRMQITNTETYTGSTTISAGDLQVDGSIGNVVLSGGSVSGTGKVGTITGNGTVDPGDNGTTLNGILNSKSVTWGASDTFFVDLSDKTTPGSPTPGTDYDQLDVTGNLTLGGANLTGAVSGTLVIGDSFTIIRVAGGTLSGTFAQGNTVFISGQKFSVIYNYITGTVVLQRVLNTATVSLTSSANPAVYGQAVIYTATVTAQAGGGAIPTSDTVTFTFDGITYAPVNVNGSGQAAFDPQTATGAPLTVGTHTLTAAYSGDATLFNPANGSLSPIQTVNKALTVITNIAFSSNTLLTNAPFSASATLAPSAPGGTEASAAHPTGTVSFSVDNGTPLTVSVPSNGLLTSPSITNVSAGVHQLTVSYSGDGNYHSYTTSVNFTVVKDSPTIILGANPSSISYGQAAGFQVQVGPTYGTGTPTGTVTFYADTISSNGMLGGGPVSLVGGQASLQGITTLTAGTHTIFAVYSGDSIFANGTTSISFLVNGDATTTNLASSLNPSSTGQAVNFTATVTNNIQPGGGTPTGSVTFLVNGTPERTVALNVLGQAAYSTVFTIGGSYTITSNYVPGSNFASSSGNLNQSVLSGTTTTLNSSANPAVFGQPVTVTATVTPAGTGTPTGLVSFVVDGGSPISESLNGSGQASLPASAYGIGTHTITATYGGDNSFGGSSSAPLSLVVNKASTSTIVAETGGSTTVFGQTATYTVTVAAVAPGAGTPTGSVQFVIDGVSQPATTLSGGTASLSLSTLTVGTHTIGAIYSGSGNFAASSMSPALSSTVTKAGTTTTMLDLGPSPSAIGQQVVFIATVNPSYAGSVPTGTIQFVVDNVVQPAVPLNSYGQAGLDTSSLSVGTHTIGAIYSGDANFKSSTSASPLVHTVGQIKTSTIVFSYGPSPTVFGQLATFYMEVVPSSSSTYTPTGYMQFIVDGVAQPVQQLNSYGMAGLYVSNLAVGPHTLLAAYGGDSHFTSSSTPTPLNFTVNAIQTSATVTSSAPNAAVGQSVTFTATVGAVAPGSGIPPGTVTFTIDGGSPTTAPLNSSGHATFTTSSLGLGSHTVAVTYNATTDYATSNASLTENILHASSTTVSGSATSSVVGQGVTFTATVSGTGGFPTGSVTFVVDGVSQTPITLNGSDQATITLSTLAAGAHAVTATYGGDTNFAPSTAPTPANLNVTAASTTTSMLDFSGSPTVAGQLAILIATVKPVAPGGGTPTGTLQFVVDGVAQPAVTLNANGQAGLDTTTLSAGVHTIGAIFNGSNNYLTSTGSPLSHTVNKANTTTIVFPYGSTAGTFGVQSTFFLQVTPVAPGAGIPTGQVQFVVDGVKQPLQTMNSYGMAGLYTSTLSVGTHSIAAIYYGDGNYTASQSSSISYTVNASNNAVKLVSVLNTTSVVVGTPFSVTATAEDAQSNLAAGFSQAAVLSVISAPSGGFVSGSSTGTFSGGTLTFSNLSVNVTGTYELEISAGGLVTTLTFSTSGRQT